MTDSSNKTGASSEGPTHWRAGVGRVVVTPDESICMWGYTGTRSSEGHASELLAQAAALEDGDGSRVVLVALDLVGFEAEMIAPIAARLEREHGLRRDQVLFNASHTHTGPLVEHVRRPIEVMYDLDAAQKATIRRYTAELQDRVVEAVATAIAALAPARLSLHRGSAGFAVSRRLLTDDGVRMGPNPAGEADHSVTVLRIADLGDVTRGVLFSYACHPTTLGSDVRELTGDYPGFARMELEASYPGAAALFLQGCGADCCPSEHGSFEVVRRHGQALATAVGEALSSPGIDESGRLSSAYCEARLAFAPLPSVAGQEVRQHRQR